MKRLLVWLAIAASLILGGCAGSSGTSTNNISRVLAGFVYVQGVAGNGVPPVAILPTATPPTGYFAPTAGTINVAIANGTVTRSTNNLDFDMSANNAVVCTVTGPPTTAITISGSGLQYNGSARAMSNLATDTGSASSNGTVLALNSGSTTYTPGPATAVMATINGGPPTNPIHFIAGDPAKSLAVVALDQSGVVTPSSYTVTTTGPAAGSVTVAGSGNAFTLTAGNTSATVGNLSISLVMSPGNGSGSLAADFALGAPAHVTLSAVSNNVLWGTVTVPVANTTTNMTATVTNVNGLALSGAAVTFNNAKAPSNTWSAAPGTCFTAITNGGVTDVNGQVTATFNPPDALDPVLSAGQKVAKGNSSVTATAGSATSLATLVAVNRPLGSIVLAGPARVDVGTLTPTTGAQAYLITGTVDVDNDSVPTPAGVQTWTLTNVDLSANSVGNTGDTVTSSSANASIAANGQVTAGTSAGQIKVSVAIGTTNSNMITTEVFGIPSRIVLTPDTVASAIPNARGEYAFGGVGQTQNFNLTLVDSAGHSAPGGEISTVTTTAIIQALTGGSITPGGVGVTSFTLTCGNADGTFDLTASGNWVGSRGGSGPINLSRIIGQNAP